MHITQASFAKKFGFVGAGTSLVVAGALLVGGSAGAAPPEKTSGQARATSITGAPVSIAPGANRTTSVVCPAGTVVTGGGGQTSAFRIFFTDSYQSGNSWVVRGTNTNTTSNESLTAVAVCR